MWWERQGWGDGEVGELDDHIVVMCLCMCGKVGGWMGEGVRGWVAGSVSGLVCGCVVWVGR